MNPTSIYHVISHLQRDEVGRVTPGQQPETGRLEQQGSFGFVGDDGNTYLVNYVANEGGFQAEGDHLPVAPQQIPAYAELDRTHPGLLWAVNRRPDVIVNDQQFTQPQQFTQSQQFTQPQQFVHNGQFVF